MDAGYKPPWIAQKILEGGKIPIMPYTRYKAWESLFYQQDFLTPLTENMAGDYAVPLEMVRLAHGHRKRVRK